MIDLPKLPEGWKWYTCSYWYQGKKWSFEIPATSFADAEGRLSAICMGEVDGELKMHVRVGGPRLSRLVQLLRRGNDAD